MTTTIDPSAPPADLDADQEQHRRRFLDPFPEATQQWIGTAVSATVRADPILTPDAHLARLQRDVRAVADALHRDPQAALDYIAHHLDRQRLTPAGRRRYLAAQKPLLPPSEPQLRFLTHLGHQGPPPATRIEAGDLIETLKTQRDHTRAEHAAKRQLEQHLDQPSNTQRRHLDHLGWTGPLPDTWELTHKLIRAIKAGQVATHSEQRTPCGGT